MSGDTYRETFDSVTDLFEHCNSPEIAKRARAQYQGKDLEFFANQSAGWDGGENCGDGTVEEVERWARDGWNDVLEDTLAIVDSAVRTVEATETKLDFETVYDVSGAVVDIDRYLIGEPECMIDYPIRSVPKPGRVITLCVNVLVSASVSNDELIARGREIVALALTLTRLGFGVEMWADASTGKYGGVSLRTLVKGANDILDPAKVLYAFAHPSMSRALYFTALSGMPPKHFGRLNFGLGPIMPTPKDLPEGTVYVEGFSTFGSDDAVESVRAQLRELGIVED
jgi:hypothetical protein